MLSKNTNIVLTGNEDAYLITRRKSTAMTEKHEIPYHGAYDKRGPDIKKTYFHT